MKERGKERYCWRAGVMSRNEREEEEREGSSVGGRDREDGAGGGEVQGGGRGEQGAH